MTQQTTTDAPAPSEYGFRDRPEDLTAALRHLADVLDPHSTAVLQGLGVAPGRRGWTPVRAPARSRRGSPTGSDPTAR
ncbi:hypothetical protein GCM10025868_25570 [Angustibacter aerolatus]|uniref:Uncharacterized protein n=1 Tax=Angustibacter aerolatus TaxID=1162965 RepID=A0ABQ6JHT4_9ACTN|nr:hypothetical protein GCM10025868_25570 [Angustibacter aerolatus]